MCKEAKRRASILYVSYAENPVLGQRLSRDEVISYPQFG